MIQWAEKDFENWLCSGDGGQWRLFDLLDAMMIDIPFPAAAWRQVSTEVGIADIVVSGPGKIIVVELKARRADGNDLLQVMAYADWLDRAAAHVKLYEENQVLSVLIAPSFADRLVLATSMMDNVSLISVDPQWVPKRVVSREDRPNLTKASVKVLHRFLSDGQNLAVSNSG